MLTSYSRVTVVSDSRRVDLALPSALPVADVLPQVLRFCGPPESPEHPHEFALARVGGVALPLSVTLGEAGVHDGDVIELRSAREENRQAYVEDVRDALEDAVDGAGGAWTSRSTVNFAVVGTCGVLAYLLVPVMHAVASLAVVSGQGMGDVSTEVTVSSVLAVLGLLALGWLASTFGSAWAATTAVATAAVTAYFTGVELLAEPDRQLSLVLVVAALVGGAVAGVGRIFSQRAIALVAVFTVLLIGPLIVLITDLAGLDDVSKTVRAIATVAVLAIGVLPRMSLAVGGLSSADYRIRNAGHITEQALQQRMREASGLLLGAVVGISVLVAAIGVWLGLMPGVAWRDGVWDTLLSLSLAAVLALRSRVFSRIVYMLPLRMAALAICLANLSQLLVSHAGFPAWTLAIVVGIGVLLTLVSVLDPSDVSRARVKRTLNWIEFIVVVDLVVVTMGALALYDWIRAR